MVPPDGETGEPSRRTRLETAVRRTLPTGGAWAELELLLRRIYARLDLIRHRDLDNIDVWGPLLAGAPKGHVVVPSRAIEESRHQASTWRRSGYLHEGCAVLDIGSGNGRQAIGLLEEGVGRYAGVDVIPECVRYCDEAFDDDRCEFHHLDVRNEMYNPQGAVMPEEVVLPFGDEEFDFVAAGSLYSHLERLPVARRYLEETHRVLRPGGYAYTSWFVSPPNTPSAQAKRTVFRRDDVYAMFADGFEVVEAAAGDSGEYHDQHQIVARRI